MKKLLKIFRTALVGLLWTYLFLIMSNYLMYQLWSFNFMSAHSWQTMSGYWNSGGVINTAPDYIFLLMLFSLPIMWLVGWILLLKIEYLSILLYPLNVYNRHIVNKYGHNSSRVILRNIKSSQKIIEEIKEQLESIKPAKSKEVNNIRQEVQKKLEELNKKN